MELTERKLALIANEDVLKEIYEQILDGFAFYLEETEYHDFFGCSGNIKGVDIIQYHHIDTTGEEKPYSDGIWFVDVDATLNKLQDELDSYFEQSNKMLDYHEHDEFKCHVLEQLFWYDENHDLKYEFLHLGDFLECKFIVFYKEE
jgi:hypothetical protein